MGFLENLVSDMVRDATGVNPRRLVRMVGGRNLLMMGAGAALAGGAFAALERSSTTAAAPPPPPPAPGFVPPPPPPPPAAAAPPPPPPPAPPAEAVPGEAAPGERAADAAPEAAPVPAAGAAPPAGSTYAIVRTMVAAALADGSMAPQEKDAIQRRLGESGLDEAQVRQIHQDLVLPPPPAELAAMAPAAEARELLYRFAALVLLADQSVNELERGWLRRLAAAFEIPADRVEELERDIFQE